MKQKLRNLYYKVATKFFTLLTFVLSAVNKNLFNWLLYGFALSFIYPLRIIATLTNNTSLNVLFCFLYVLLLVITFALLRIYNAIIRNTEYLIALKGVMDIFNKNSLSVSQIYKNSSISFNTVVDGFKKTVEEFTQLVQSLINSLNK